MDTNTTKKIAQLLAMLGSDYAGERLNALGAIDTVLKNNSLTWTDISNHFAGKNRPSLSIDLGSVWGDLNQSRTDYDKFIDKALQHRDCLTKSQIAELEGRKGKGYWAFGSNDQKMVLIWGRIKAKTKKGPWTDIEVELDKGWQEECKRREQAKERAKQKIPCVQATELTASSCPRRTAISLPVAASQTRAVSSQTPSRYASHHG
jgi:hypothetical protein